MLLVSKNVFVISNLAKEFAKKHFLPHSHGDKQINNLHKETNRISAI
jgi:hypothetical protein